MLKVVVSIFTCILLKVILIPGSAFSAMPEAIYLKLKSGGSIKCVQFSFDGDKVICQDRLFKTSHLVSNITEIRYWDETFRPENFDALSIKFALLNEQKSNAQQSKEEGIPEEIKEEAGKTRQERIKYNQICQEECRVSTTSSNYKFDRSCWRKCMERHGISDYIYYGH